MVCVLVCVLVVHSCSRSPHDTASVPQVDDEDGSLQAPSDFSLLLNGVTTIDRFTPLMYATRIADRQVRREVMITLLDNPECQLTIQDSTGRSALAHAVLGCVGQQTRIASQPHDSQDDRMDVVRLILTRASMLFEAQPRTATSTASWAKNSPNNANIQPATAAAFVAELATDALPFAVQLDDVEMCQLLCAFGADSGFGGGVCGCSSNIVGAGLHHPHVKSIVDSRTSAIHVAVVGDHLGPLEYFISVPLQAYNRRCTQCFPALAKRDEAADSMSSTETETNGSNQAQQSIAPPRVNRITNERRKRRNGRRRQRAEQQQQKKGNNRTAIRCTGQSSGRAPRPITLRPSTNRRERRMRQRRERKVFSTDSESDEVAEDVQMLGEVDQDVDVARTKSTIDSGGDGVDADADADAHLGPVRHEHKAPAATAAAFKSATRGVLRRRRVAALQQLVNITTLEGPKPESGHQNKVVPFLQKQLSEALALVPGMKPSIPHGQHSDLATAGKTGFAALMQATTTNTARVSIHNPKRDFTERAVKPAYVAHGLSCTRFRLFLMSCVVVGTLDVTERVTCHAKQTR